MSDAVEGRFTILYNTLSLLQKILIVHLDTRWAHQPTGRATKRPILCPTRYTRVQDSITPIMRVVESRSERWSTSERCEHRERGWRLVFMEHTPVSSTKMRYKWGPHWALKRNNIRMSYVVKVLRQQFANRPRGKRNIRVSCHTRVGHRNNSK